MKLAYLDSSDFAYSSGRPQKREEKCADGWMDPDNGKRRTRGVQADHGKTEALHVEAERALLSDRVSTENCARSGEAHLKFHAR